MRIARAFAIVWVTRRYAVDYERMTNRVGPRWSAHADESRFATRALWCMQRVEHTTSQSVAAGDPEDITQYDFGQHDECRGDERIRDPTLERVGVEFAGLARAVM